MVIDEEMAVANSRVSLVRRVKTDSGWRYYPAAYAANGKVKPGVVVVNGMDVKYPAGHYALRYYQGTKLIVEGLKGASPAEAEAKRIVKGSRMSAMIVAREAGIAIKVHDPLKHKTLTAELGQFLSETASRGSLKALEAYRLACDEFLKVSGRQYADEIEPGDVVKYQKALADRGMSARTVCNRHTNLKTFLKFLGYDIKRLPKPPRYDKTMPEIYTDTELKTFLKAVTSPREVLLFRLLLQTGVREQEAMYIEWDDADSKRKVLKLRSKVKRWGFRLKDFEERELPLSDEVLLELMAYKRDHSGSSTLVFDKEGKPDSHMLRTLKQHVRAAGLNCGKCDGCLSKSKECENWYLHKFRATYCTKLLRAGFDLRTVQQMMGHSDLASTMRYLRPAENEQTQARINSMHWT
jgi:integrase